MDINEFDDLNTILSKEEKVTPDYDYEGFAVLDNLKMSKEDLKKAVDIMWEIVMTSTSKERDERYLFSKGLIKSKEVFLSTKEKYKDTTGDEKDKFNKTKEIFRERLESVKPLVEFLIKVKEII